MRRVEEVRRRRGHLGGMAQWVVPGWSEFIMRPLADLTVTAQGQSIDGVAHVLVTRVRSYAGSMSMPAGIDIGDGTLHVLTFPRRSKLALIGMGLRAVAGRLRTRRGVHHITTRGPVRIEGVGGEPFHIDGDHAGELPVDVVLTEERVRLVVP